jgi:hypothetical protein
MVRFQGVGLLCSNRSQKLVKKVQNMTAGVHHPGCFSLGDSNGRTNHDAGTQSGER